MDAGKDKKNLPWAVWAFKWERNTLQIFRTNRANGLEKISDDRPYLVLHRIR